MPETSFITYNPDGRSYSRRIKDEEWSRLRPVLDRMHRDKITRGQMLQTLEQEYNFRPSAGQLHARMRQWGYSVYNTNQCTNAEEFTSDTSTVESSEDIVPSISEIKYADDENHAPSSSSKSSTFDVNEVTMEDGTQLNAFQKSLEAAFAAFCPPLDKGVTFAVLRYFEYRVNLQSKSLTATLERLRDQVAQQRNMSPGILLQYWTYRQQRSIPSADSDLKLLLSLRDAQESPLNMVPSSTLSAENRYDLVTMVADIFMAVGCPAAAFASYLIAYSCIEQQPEVSTSGRGWILLNIVRVAIIFKDHELAELYFNRFCSPNNGCHTLVKILKSHFERLADLQVLDESFCARHALFLNILRSRELLSNHYLPVDYVMDVHALYTAVFKCELAASFLKRLLLWTLSLLDLGKAFLMDCTGEKHRHMSRSGLGGHLANLFACFLLQQWFLAPEDLLLSIMAEIADKHGRGFRGDLTIPETLSAFAHMIFRMASDFAHLDNTTIFLDAIIGVLEPALVELITGSEEDRCTAFVEAYLGRFTAQYIANETESGELCAREALCAVQLFIQRNKEDVAVTAPLSSFKISLDSKSQKLYNSSPTNKAASSTLREIGRMLLSKDHPQVSDFSGLFELLSTMRESCDRPNSGTTVSSLIPKTAKSASSAILSMMPDRLFTQGTMFSSADIAQLAFRKNHADHISQCRFASSTGEMEGTRPSTTPTTPATEGQIDNIRKTYQPLARPHAPRTFSPAQVGHEIKYRSGESVWSGSIGSGSSASTISYRSMLATSSRAHTMHLERQAGLYTLSPTQTMGTQESWGFSEVTGMPMDDSPPLKDSMLF